MNITKNFSTNIIEDHVISDFKNQFLENTFPEITTKNILALAQKRSLRKGTEEEDELLKVQKEFDELGNLLFSFDSGTTPALKQMRHILLMSKAGSVNFEMDEMGSNLLSNQEVLTTYLSLFDVGLVKQKLIKNTKENSRNEEIDGRTPTNMLLFGTPSKLFDGSKTEDEFYSMLETGYARRCIFGLGEVNTNITKKSPSEVYDDLTNQQLNIDLMAISKQLGMLAEIQNFETELTMTRDISELVIEYDLKCREQSQNLAEHEEIQKAELTHRYFKALKLAGTYAFIDGSDSIEEKHLYGAIKLVEDSGKAFHNILTRPKNYERLARYLANIGKEVTHTDLIEDLPFYKGSESQRKELMKLAISYGYRKNIVIKSYFADGVEFLAGESLKETHLDEMIVSYSQEITEGYENKQVAFDQLHKLTQANGYHYCVHHLVDGYRDKDHIILPFNLVVLDVDEGTPLATAKLLLKEYTYLMYTTKRHTDALNRYRIIIPISHILKLKEADYKKFMENIYEWLPFEVDTQTNDISRKWLANQGQYDYNSGILLDALQFIPSTKKNEDRQEAAKDYHNLNSLERWFLERTDSGNRNNMMIQYALSLVDQGYEFENIRNSVLAFNDKLADSIDEQEIYSTILVTVSKKIAQRDTSQGE